MERDWEKHKRNGNFMLKNRKAIKKQKKMTMSMKIIPTDFSLVSQFTFSNELSFFCFVYWAWIMMGTAFSLSPPHNLLVLWIEAINCWNWKPFFLFSFSFVVFLNFFSHFHTFFIFSVVFVIAIVFYFNTYWRT